MTDAAISKEDVVRSIGWIDGMDDNIDWDSADWSAGDLVKVEGRTTDGKYVVGASFQMTTYWVQEDQSDDIDDWDYLDDDEGDDA